MSPHWLRDKTVSQSCVSVAVFITLKGFQWCPKCQCGGGQGNFDGQSCLESISKRIRYVVEYKFPYLKGWPSSMERCDTGYCFMVRSPVQSLLAAFFFLKNKLALTCLSNTVYPNFISNLEKFVPTGAPEYSCYLLLSNLTGSRYNFRYNLQRGGFTVAKVPLASPTLTFRASPKPIRGNEHSHTDTTLTHHWQSCLEVSVCSSTCQKVIIFIVSQC